MALGRLSVPNRILMGFLLLIGRASGQALGVCEVLERLEDLKGRHVAVRGVWKPGDAGQFLLSEHPCPHARIWQGWKWQDFIQVAPSGKGANVTVTEYLRMRGGRGSHMMVLGTFWGQIQSYDHIELRRLPDGSKRPTGFRFAVASLLYQSAGEFKTVPYGPSEEERQYQLARSPFPELAH